MQRALVVVGGLLLAAGPAWGQAGDKEEIQARALFVEANNRMQKGDFAGAVELYEEAFRRYPDNPKILLNLGTARKKAGRNAAAANAYQAYLVHPKMDPEKQVTVEGLLKELDAKVAILRIEIDEPGATIRLDGEDLGASPQTLTRRVEPGPHMISAGKEGFTPSQASITVNVGDTREVHLRLIRRPDEPRTGRTTPLDDPTGVVAGVDHSHRGRFGVFGRVDVDGNELGRGAAFAGGATFGIGDRLELMLGGIAGPNFGLSAGGSVFVMTGAWKPLVSVALPIYFLDSGALVGAHAAVGVQWDPTASLGFFLHAGLQYYFGAPEGISDLAFVPSLGAQLRL